MKKAVGMCCKNSINRLRDELHDLIESENLTSAIVQERSRDLDNLIYAYYQQIKNNQDLNEA